MMDEFAHIDTVLERIGYELQRHTKERIQFCEIAAALRMGRSALLSRKARGTIPFAAILQFCRRTGLHPEYILFVRRCQMAPNTQKKLSTASR